MAQLPSNEIDRVWSDVMSEFSSFWTLVPISKDQLRALLVLIDRELETAETSIVQSLPAGAGKTWLIDNVPLGRGLMIDTLRKRKEVL